jgi:hypothetical protein
MVEHADRICQALPGANLDAAIGQLMIDTLTPLAVEAALTVAAELEQRAGEAAHRRPLGPQPGQRHPPLAT